LRIVGAQIQRRWSGFDAEHLRGDRSAAEHRRQDRGATALKALVQHAVWRAAAFAGDAVTAIVSDPLGCGIWVGAMLRARRSAAVAAAYSGRHHWRHRNAFGRECLRLVGNIWRMVPVPERLKWVDFCRSAFERKCIKADIATSPVHDLLRTFAAHN
jgi:hypothetical protein